MILQGDALTWLKQINDNSIDCCVTSPPYWALRDYKTEGQLGLEPTFQEYLDHLIQMFAQVKRVVKSTGAIWVNIGDTYGPTKSLIGIPERFKIRMIDELGLICRNTIIWYKPNCMPSSAKDRFTVDFEYLYFFTKSPRYYFETQYEPHTRDWSMEKDFPGWKNGTAKYKVLQNRKTNFINPRNELGRLKRCVWRVSTKPFSGAHFAVFPPDLITTPIKATCPEQICNKCNNPTKIIYDESFIPTRPGRTIKDSVKSRTESDPAASFHSSDWSRYKLHPSRTPTGMTSCGCNADFHPGIVLDPFAGASTTGLVALQQRKHFIGIEISEPYIAIAKARLIPLLRQQTL